MIESARPAIVARIKDANIGFNTVIGSINLQEILRQGWQSPACFVWRDSTQPTDVSSYSVSQYRSTYAVIIAYSIQIDNGSVDDEIERLSNGLMGALLGNWKPNGLAPLIYEGGQAFPKPEKNLFLWRDNYSLQQTLRYG